MERDFTETDITEGSGALLAASAATLIPRKTGKSVLMSTSVSSPRLSSTTPPHSARLQSAGRLRREQRAGPRARRITEHDRDYTDVQQRIYTPKWHLHACLFVYSIIYSFIRLIVDYEIFILFIDYI